MDTQQVKKKWYMRWWVWALAILGVFIILATLGGSSAPEKVGSTNGTNATEETVFKVGDQVRAGDTILTVTGVKRDWRSTNQFDKPNSPDNAYVLVTVEIQNAGEDTLDLSSMFDFKLEDGSGAIRNQSIGGVGIKNLSSVGALAPGGKASGDILFEASRTALDRLVLHYEPTFSFGDAIAVELQ